MFRFLLALVVLFSLSCPAFSSVAPEVSVPILLYHRFGPTVADGMTITTPVFDAHMKYLHDNGYKVIPLRQLVQWYQGKAAAPAPKSVVIVEDDAHKTVYSDMLPIIQKYRYPVTIFVYPSAISNAKYAMTWDQLRKLKKTGLFDIQSHTYWHPNFKREKRKLAPAAYDKLVMEQLLKSRKKLEQEVGGPVDLLAWPFGIYDEHLLQKAREAGFVSTFSIERRHATAREKLLILPRYLLVNADKEKAFAQLMQGNAVKRNVVY
ncbi:polysaccharide deacetylase family protein [Trichlorobacter lovleyi]|uniref:polysaccharide deacetylase family protein n=1 Tax=Trichlorobacter lovleyi TaxID=313985 RepID=UPI00223EA0C5|nr:polysaccharide deacetylase family protein [Trichlorobacter lovleyi]QOX80081.1 polysaccharide deacetylase family protein [Trichlorobacter lovleyi]